MVAHACSKTGSDGGLRVPCATIARPPAAWGCPRGKGWVAQSMARTISCHRACELGRVRATTAQSRRRNGWHEHRPILASYSIYLHAHYHAARLDQEYTHTHTRSGKGYALHSLLQPRPVECPGEYLGAKYLFARANMPTQTDLVAGGRVEARLELTLSSRRRCPFFGHGSCTHTHTHTDINT